MLALAIVLTIISSALLVVSIILLIATVGIRWSVTRDLIEQGREYHAIHEQWHMMNEMFHNVMESGAIVDGKYNHMKNEVEQALQHQQGMLNSEIARLSHPDDKTLSN